MLRTTHDLVKHLKDCDLNNKAVILKAGAAWCQPCRRIAPVFSRLSEEWQTKTACVFLEFNINENRLLARYFCVRDVPSFICLLPKKSSVLLTHELRHVGADEEQLKKWVQRVLGPN
jgi:thiol-disulfide isomerase/thioredoxin